MESTVLFSKLKNYLTIYLIVASLVSCQRDEKTVKDVIDNKISYLYKTMDSAQLMSMDYDRVFSLFSDDEKVVLATRHEMFDVNVPVVVSVMRSKEQKIVPFWLPVQGFVKTDLTMKNEQTTYEVWQKSFKPETVGLGINGFENYSLHYFVSVSPQKSGDDLELTNFFPANQYVGNLNNGAFTYHDWDELVLSDVPETMKGQKLLTTVRGRGVESWLVGESGRCPEIPWETGRQTIIFSPVSSGAKEMPGSTASMCLTIFRVWWS